MEKFNHYIINQEEENSLYEDYALEMKGSLYIKAKKALIKLEKEEK